MTSPSDNEGDVISLRIVTKVKTNKAVEQSLVEPKEEPVLQECAPGEKPKPKRRKRRKSKVNKHGSSSGTDTSESGSWESLVLETPDGVRKEFIVKPTIEPKLELQRKEDENATLMVVTRAQAKHKKETSDETNKVESSKTKTQKKRRNNRKQRKRSQCSDISLEKVVGKRHIETK